MTKIEELVKENYPIKSLYGLKQEFIPGKTYIPYSGSVWTEDEIVAAIDAILNGKWFSSGENIHKFEREIARIIGMKYGLMVNSGSSANLLMVAALRSKKVFGDKKMKAITPAVAFPTTVAPLIQYGIEPVFVDVEMDTLNLNLDQVEEKLKQDKDIKILMFAHVLGNPPNMDRVMELVNKYNLIFLEDSCDALGSKWGNRNLGTFGAMSSYSFYPAHHISTGEGGAVLTNNELYGTILRSLAWWGRDCYCVGSANLLPNGTCNCRFSNWLTKLPDIVTDHKYIFTEVGYNLKPLDLQGAIGLKQLEKLNYIHERRQYNYNFYYEFFRDLSDIFILNKPHSKADVSWFGFPITVNTNKFTKNEFVNYLEAHKIQTRNYFAGNILLHPAFDHLDDAFKYPNAIRCTKDTFFLGVSPNLTDDQKHYITHTIKEFLKGKQ